LLAQRTDHGVPLSERGEAAGLADPDVLGIAAEQDRILVTHDFKTMPRHFAHFLQRNGSSPGVFVVKQSSPIGSVIEGLVLIWTATDAEEWKGRILRIPPRRRVALL